MSTELQSKLEAAKEAALQAAKAKDAEIGPPTKEIFDDTYEQCMRELAFNTAKLYLTRNRLDERTLGVVSTFFTKALTEIVQSRRMGWSYLGPKLDLILKGIDNPKREVSGREIEKLALGQSLGIQALIAGSGMGGIQR